MGNLITVYKGDENRAKIETVFSAEDFFSAVYHRACKALEKIVKETQIYKKAHKNNDYKIKFQGMGNNTIIFTAERGQGKTSAMQSFAELLRNPDKFARQLNPIESVYFHVLDAIDPSTLDKKENIIRVLLSRLFFAFEKKYSDSKTLSGESVEQAHDREVLLKLLMDCYDNVEILRENSERDKDQDDLEHLAQLGNSAKLKENLNALIEKFLKIMLPDKSGERYLVIQIDDVDLSTGDIYDICEDIHRYFSVPNVIVLMAADYSQLRYALCERYLKQYKELQDDRSKVKIYDKCHDMATRYLEKVFPEGHRIELPVLQEMTVEDYVNLNILYIEKPVNQDDCMKPVQGETKKPENLCTYLLQSLYIKTGIILLNTKDIVHPLLPRTMRELTHFINMLDEMPEIDFALVCSNIEKGGTAKEKIGGGNSTVDEGKAEQERQNLNHNLSRLKRFFLYDWCTNYLDETQWDMIQAIDMCDPQRKKRRTVSLLSEYINKNVKASLRFSASDISYHDIMREIENNKTLQDQVDFQYALLFYYTLFLNEWFVKALGQENSMSRCVDFVGGLIYSSRVIEECCFNGFRVNSFVVSGDILMKRMHMAFGGSFSDRHASLLKAVGIPLGLDTPVDTAEESVSWINNIWNPVEETNLLWFDNFRLLEYILIDGGWRNQAKDSWKISNSESQDNKQDDSNSNDIIDVILSVKNIFTNYEVQQKIQKNIEQYCRKQTEGHLVDYYENLHVKLDSWLDETGYAPNVIKSNLGKFLDAYLIDTGILNDILLSNEYNIETYRNQYSGNVIKAFVRLEINMHRMLTILDQAEDIAAKIAAIQDWSVDNWQKIVPELLPDCKMPDDEACNQNNSLVKKAKEQYDKILTKKNEYLLLLESDNMLNAIEQMESAMSSAILDEASEKSGEGTDSIEEVKKEPANNEKDVEKKRHELMRLIRVYTSFLKSARRKINASRARES